MARYGVATLREGYQNEFAGREFGVSEWRALHRFAIDRGWRAHMSGQKEPNVAVEIGLGARASLEAKISTEIPAQSSGRLVDALTDIIRPFSERRGLKADQVRLQREEVLIEIARRARHRLEIGNQPINPLPNKFLVPFLEKASLEELDSVLLDRWADLLASCSADPASAHPRFVQILSELNAEEAQLLRDIALNNINATPPEETYLNIGIAPEFVKSTLERYLYHSKDTARALDVEFLGKELQTNATRILSRPGSSLVGISIRFRKDGKSVRVPYEPGIDAPAARGRASNTSINVLGSLYLLTYHIVEISDIRFARIYLSYVCLTLLASDFLKKCDRDLGGRLRFL